MNNKEREEVKEAMCKRFEGTGTFEGRAIAAHARASGLPACYMADQLALNVHGASHGILTCVFTISSESGGDSGITVMPPLNLEVEGVRELMQHIIEYAQKIVDGVKPTVELHREGDPMKA